MTSATSFLNTVSQVQSDISTVSEFSKDFGTSLSAAKDILEVPGKLENTLRDPAEAMDLPDPVVAVLGLVPFGIGTAIKTIDRIGEATAEVLEQQADIMGALDDAWSIPRTAVSTLKPVNSALGAGATGASFVNAQMQEEAVRLVDSLSNQKIDVHFDLVNRMEGYKQSAEEWFETRDALLAPFQAAAAAFEDALEELASILPDTELFEDATEALLIVMQPISDAAEDLKDAICIDFTVSPRIVIPGTPAIVVTPAIPAIYGTNPFTGKKFLITPAVPAVIIPAIPETVIPAVVVDICQIITQAQSGFDAIVEQVVNQALALIGVDFEAIAESLQDELLAPLQPIFDVIAQLQAEAANVIAQLMDELQPLIDGMADMLDALDDATTVASLFENTIEGDKALGPEDMADVLTGTDGEDAIFGLTGNDTITGGGGDFLFGGEGHDILNSLGDEVYGGVGRDILNGSALSDRMDGGSGRDKLFGGGGDDFLFGGDGVDLLKGGKGADLLDGGKGADKLIAGNGADILFGGNGADKLNGGNGADDLSGGNGADTLNGGNSNDLMAGGNGSDVFVFSGTFGNDTITDFDANDDNEKIDLSAVSEILDLADLLDNHTSEAGDDLIIAADNGNSITLENVALGDLNAADFIF